MFAKFRKIRPLRRYHYYCILHTTCSFIYTLMHIAYICIHNIRTSHCTRIEKNDSKRLFAYIHNIHGELTASAHIIHVLFFGNCTYNIYVSLLGRCEYRGIWFFCDFWKFKALIIFSARFKKFRDRIRGVKQKYGFSADVFLSTVYNII